MTTPRPALTAARLGAQLGVLGLLVAACCVLALAYGSSNFGGWDAISGMLTGTLDDSERTILFTARLPRVVFGLMVGAVLGASGATFQAILRNPLAEPYILGVSGGAAVGATMVVAFGAGAGGLAALGVAGAAFAGALVAVGLILAVGGWGAGRVSTYVLLLTGVIFNAFAGAVIMFVKSIVAPQKAHELLFYLMGSLDVEGVASEQTFVVGVACVVSLLAQFYFARDLNILVLGDEQAATMGVDPDRSRRGAVLAASLGVATAVAYTGLIGFVGLVVPHAVRVALGPDHRLLLPASALAGGGFLVLADLVARASFGLFSTALPVGVVTAFIGGPLFVLFLRSQLQR